MSNLTLVKTRILNFVNNVRTTRTLLGCITGPNHWTEEEITQALCELENDNKITKITKPGEEPYYIPVVEAADLEGFLARAM